MIFDSRVEEEIRFMGSSQSSSTIQSIQLCRWCSCLWLLAAFGTLDAAGEAVAVVCVVEALAVLFQAFVALVLSLRVGAAFL